jgi:PhnB protein
MMLTHGQQPNPWTHCPNLKTRSCTPHHHRRDELLRPDVPPGRFQPMRSAYLSLLVGSVEEAERIYDLLSDSGEIFMPMEETFFAFRFAMLRDKFGTSWMILYERPRP